MTWKKKIAGTAAMFILGFIFILPVLWIVMNSIKLRLIFWHYQSLYILIILKMPWKA